MGNEFLKFDNVGFGYPTVPEPIFRDLTVHLTQGWTGVIGANGTGKTTLLKLATGILQPGSGWIHSGWKNPFCLYCEQRTDQVPQPLEEMLFANDKTANILIQRLGIGQDWPYRWETLSHGERKRAQVGLALWQSPSILAVDEPFNHIDTDARCMLAEALAQFDGVGLMVAHDRDMMDSLCSQCLFIDPPDVIRRPGGYTQAMGAIENEQQAIQKVHLKNKRKLGKLHKELNRRKQVQQQSRKKGSKRHLDKKDHDGRFKIDGARLTGKDAIAGRLQKQMENRVNRFREEISAISVKKTYDTGIWFPDAISHRDFLFCLPGGEVSLGEDKTLIYPELAMKPTDRIGISGPNGSGKSTLIRDIVQSLRLDREKVIYIPQEIDGTRAQQLLQEIKELPNEQLGVLMTAINRLGSRPHRLLGSENPSPGETRKLMLAMGISRAPHLIIMDEPTNHMDLVSVECLEQALQECPCGLLLVSHDRRFLKNLTETDWRIASQEGLMRLKTG